MSYSSAISKIHTAVRGESEKVLHGWRKHINHETYCTCTTLMERRQRKALREIKELRGPDEQKVKYAFDL